MKALLRIWHAVFGCRHTHTYRERRKLHGVRVMHFVCEACGNATPAVERTAKEHRRAVHVSEVPSARLVRTAAPASNVRKFRATQ
jgi:hypothetical protein